MSSYGKMELKPPHDLNDIYPMEIKRWEVQKHLCALVETQRWNSAKSEREQVLYALESCKDHGLNISQYEIARFFGIERSTVQYHIQQGIDPFDPGTRKIKSHAILTDDEKGTLINWIYSTYEQNFPATYQMIKDFIKEKFEKDIILDTIRHIVYTTNELKVVKGIPMENDRIFC